MASSQLFRQWKAFWLAIAIREQRLVDLCKEAYRYYGNAEFRAVDMALIFNYLFDNPYTLSRRFLQGRGQKLVHAYGETPLMTMEEIVKRSGISPVDVVFDLGCGRGRVCFWLNCFVGCRVVGIELNPTFVDRAVLLDEKFHMNRVEFREGDIREANLAGATVIYLYGTLYDEAFLHRLIRRLSHLPQGTKVITVSYPLADYTKMPLFEVVDTFDLPFLHGTSTVYVQKRL